jgi:hypothetical protein
VHQFRVSSLLIVLAAVLSTSCAVKHMRGPDPQVIIDAYKEQKQGVQDCYYRALEKHPDLAGEVTLAWTVLGSGLVDTAWIKETSLDHQGLESCLLDHLKAVVFPKTKRFAKVSVEYSLTFKKQSAQSSN